MIVKDINKVSNNAFLLFQEFKILEVCFQTLNDSFSIPIYLRLQQQIWHFDLEISKTIRVLMKPIR